MTRGERVKQIRKSAGLTLEKFGEHVGLKKSSLSQIETGKNALTDQVCKAICREFDIDEHWLRTGEGQPQASKTRSEMIASFAGNLMKDKEDSFRRRLVEALAQLDEKEWLFLEEIAKKATKKD